MTYWRELPSMVVAREGDATVIKSQLAQRFQDAIDDAAMRLGDTGADAYLAGWARGEWTPAEGGGTEVCDRVVAELEKAVAGRAADRVPRRARGGAVGALSPDPPNPPRTDLWSARGLPVTRLSAG